MSDQTANTPAVRTSHLLLGIVTGWLPVLTAVVGALWGLWIYIDEQKAAREAAAATAAKENRSRIIEAQKPFLDRQLDRFFETAEVAGKLVQLKREDPLWIAAVDRFWELYWVELSMVEQQGIEAAMVDFGNELRRITPPNADTDRKSLQQSAYRLAHALRNGVADSWSTPDSQVVARGSAL